MIKDKLFSFFFCFYIFWNAIVFAVIGKSGVEFDGGLLRVILMAVFGISFLFFFLYGVRKKDIKVFSILALFGLLYYLTQFFYSSGNLEGYNGQLLRWGADCVSASLIGISLLKMKSHKFIHRLMPLLCIILTPLFVKATLENAMMSGQMHLEGGMNYQTVAYNLAVLFGISVYYTFINKVYKNIFVKVALLACLPLQIVACCMSGGRGGVVLLVIYVLMMMYIMLKSRIVSKHQLLFILFFCSLSFIFIANYLNLWNSAGFTRSSGLMEDKDRFELWASIWHFVESNHYMGYGLGGDYFTFGFYTHNIILDFILETGIIGFCILFAIFYKIYIFIFKKSFTDDIFILLSIIGVFGLVMNMFSGYWITTYAHWMMLGVYVTYKKYKSAKANQLRVVV